ncbi:hypothetical protein H2248_008979 [Termitomyces sp. 'cryptogamus']|nr:hypothetical protein H2248_008979 [Termitomyces sp. 'cryptogamus']
MEGSFLSGKETSSVLWSSSSRNGQAELNHVNDPAIPFMTMQPQVFTAIGFSDQQSELLANWSVVKVVATAILVFFWVETLGRKLLLLFSALGMGIFFYIIVALLKTHSPPSLVQGQFNPQFLHPRQGQWQGYSISMCAFIQWAGVGPLPWVYVSDIFPTPTKHYGLAVANGSQWLWNFVLANVTPQMITNLSYEIFLMFATVNFGVMAVFFMLIPETEMDVIFGAISADQRPADIEKQTQNIEEHSSKLDPSEVLGQL